MIFVISENLRRKIPAEAVVTVLIRSYHSAEIM